MNICARQILTNSKLVILIPAYNEAESIGRVLQGLTSYDVILVDDGSTDLTANIAESMGVSVVRHQRNRGYDEALNSGFKAALDSGYQYLITFDADGQHFESDLQRIFNLLDCGADLVVGQRPSYQRLSEHIFGMVTAHLGGVIDPLSGMKGYRLEVIRTRNHFSTYASIGTEWVFYAICLKCRIVSTPIKVKERLDRSRFGSLISGNLKIFKSLMLGIFFYNSCKRRL